MSPPWRIANESSGRCCTGSGKAGWRGEAGKRNKSQLSQFWAALLLTSQHWMQIMRALGRGGNLSEFLREDKRAPGDCFPISEWNQWNKPSSVEWIVFCVNLQRAAIFRECCKSVERLVPRNPRSEKRKRKMEFVFALLLLFMVDAATALQCYQCQAPVNRTLSSLELEWWL